PVAAPDDGNARYPAIVPGAGDRFALAYLGGRVGTNGDAAEVWDLRLVVVDHQDGKPRTVAGVLVPQIHVGAICQSVNECRSTSGRFYLDFFEMDLRPD